MAPTSQLFTPRMGYMLMVLIIARISTDKQDKRSLDDQIAYCKEYLARYYNGPLEFRIIRSQGSGEYLDRQELIEAEELVSSRRLDLVICEDLGRILRRLHAMIFCEHCEDQDTRLVAINDQIDTTRPDWRLNAFFASMKHEMSNKDTSDRIKRTLRNRFMQHGGVLPKRLYGYVMKPGCKTDADLIKDPKAEPIYDEWFRRLEDGESCAQVADWLNELGICTGPSCRKKKWDANSVRRVTRNPILKGLRLHNKTKSRRINKTGRKKCVPALPEELLTRNCPHLAHIEPERFDRVNRLLDERNEPFAEGHRLAVLARNGVFRKPTKFPGQHLRCGVCGRTYYWGGNGRIDYMMCSGSREYLCWNGFSVKGYEAAKLVSEAVFKKIEALREFDTHFLEQLQLSITDRMKHLDSEQAETGLELKQLEGQLGNVTDAISKSGFSEALRGKLEELEARRRELRTKLEMSKRQPRPRVIIPSIAELKTKARETMTRLAITSPEFYRLICRLIPEMHVIPYRLIEGKSIGLRIHFTLDLAPFLATSCDMDQLEGVIRHPMTVDLFDLPTREMIRKQVIDLRKQGTFIRAVAAQLGHSPLEVQRAMKIQKMMESSGLPDPWIRLNKAPDDYRNLSRHRHKRFQFQPKPGYPLL